MISEELMKQAIADTRENGQARCVTTRIGRVVRVHGDDSDDAEYPIYGAIQGKGGWELATWMRNGVYARERDVVSLDLIPARRSGEATLGIYEARGDGEVLALADCEAPRGWRLIARVPVKWTEGDGL